MSWLWYSLVLMVIFQMTSAAKILAYFPMPWKSHQFVYRPLMKALAHRGHEIDFYTTLPMPNPPKNLNQIVVTDVMKEFNYNGTLDMFSIFALSSSIYDVHRFIMEKIFEKEKAFIDLIQSNATYDLLILEPVLSMEPLSYLAHKFSAPYINIVALPDSPWNNEASGLPDNPSYVVSFLGSRTETFFQRLYNFYVTESLILSFYWEITTTQQELADKYLRYEGWQNRPKLTEMISDAALVLMNSHVSISTPYPRPPHMKEVGGIHIDPEPLPKDLREFMDDAPHGVIYFSLGSVVDPKEMLADGKFDVFLKVFRGLKQKIMWKVSKGMPQIDDVNIKLQYWYPQQPILEHKNVVLFITHGGMQSMVEAISFGVPCIGLPVFFDQMKNVDFMVDAGTTIRLDFNNLTETSVSWAVNQLLTNPSYRAAAKERQNLFESRPMKPIEEGVYWTEYVLKHGKVLQPAAVHLPFYQLYLLDILAVILLIVFIFLWCVRKAVHLLFAIAFQRANNSTIKTRKID